MVNALTIDVEDYFHVTAFEQYVKPEEWECYPSRVVDNTLRVLDILDETSKKATFFVLGWVAERNPSLVRTIQERGHDIASHGYAHELVYRIGPVRFRDDIRRAKRLIEDVTGKEVTGYRAPSYSITKKSLWAYDILLEEGFSYDSSVFPILHDIYGIPDAQRFPYDVKRPSGTLKEFPLSTIQLRLSGLEYRVPIAGGGYLRLFPTGLIKRAIQHINHTEQQPAVLYFHPWEIDPKQPRIAASFKSRFRHYLNLDKTADKVRCLLRQFDFGPMKDILYAQR
ncbi:MAG: XrtA system polysaccharide deacetylase [Nitrospirota bacterium]